MVTKDYFGLSAGRAEAIEFTLGEEGDRSSSTMPLLIDPSVAAESGRNSAGGETLSGRCTVRGSEARGGTAVAGTARHGYTRWNEICLRHKTVLRACGIDPIAAKIDLPGSWMKWSAVQVRRGQSHHQDRAGVRQVGGASGGPETTLLNVEPASLKK